MIPDYDQIDRDAFADWMRDRDLECEPLALALSKIRTRSAIAARKLRARIALDELKIKLK